MVYRWYRTRKTNGLRKEAQSDSGASLHHSINPSLRLTEEPVASQLDTNNKTYLIRVSHSIAGHSHIGPHIGYDRPDCLRARHLIDKLMEQLNFSVP